MSKAYEQSGVSLEAGYESVNRIIWNWSFWSHV